MNGWLSENLSICVFMSLLFSAPDSAESPFVVSFIYIAGTVIHIGHSSHYQMTRWESGVASRVGVASKRGAPSRLLTCGGYRIL